MTKRECAIVMAYTGVAMLQGKDLGIFYNYLREKLGEDIWTHELSKTSTEIKIKRACKDDFIKLCRDAVEEDEWYDKVITALKAYDDRNCPDNLIMFKLCKEATDEEGDDDSKV